MYVHNCLLSTSKKHDPQFSLTASMLMLVSLHEIGKLASSLPFNRHFYYRRVDTELLQSTGKPPSTTLKGITHLRMAHGNGLQFGV